MIDLELEIPVVSEIGKFCFSRAVLVSPCPPRHFVIKFVRDKSPPFMIFFVGRRIKKVLRTFKSNTNCYHTCLTKNAS